MKASLIATITCILTVSSVNSIVLAGSNRRTLDSRTVITTCNNNSGRSETQFQLISSRMFLYNQWKEREIIVSFPKL
ncbi:MULTISPECIES: hypothetical protein [Nostocales]|uniref:hypothetical protein n=1 Tax=Nostocales TaxID=1161 RepID=UPI00168317CD|nr:MULTISPECIES: hypothetical protein [Nostocales]